MAEEGVNHFNVRVYGLIINDKNELLVSDEYCQNQYMTKFPGGGLEYGEGLIEGLKREFIEECEQEVEVLEHFYTTDFYIKSVFRGGGQLLSVYYLCRFREDIKFKCISTRYDGIPPINDSIAFRCIPIDTLNVDDLSWPVDKHVVALIKAKNKSKN